MLLWSALGPRRRTSGSRSRRSPATSPAAAPAQAQQPDQARKAAERAAERLSSLEGSRTLAATQVGQRPRAGASRASDTAANQPCEGRTATGACGQ